MSARDLVGRPLVPFFDAEENVNELLRVDHATQAQEQLDVDARVWDRELDYFVYPNEVASAAPTAHSRPIAIKRHDAAQAQANGASGNGSYSKLLLTPDMLFSRSAPTAGQSGMQHLEKRMHGGGDENGHVPVTAPEIPVAATGSVSTPRSSSAKRSSSRSKNRSSTPNRTRTKQRGSPPPPPTTDGGGSSGGEGGGGRSGSDNGNSNSNAKNTKAISSKKNRNKQQTPQQQQQQQAKAKEELSANGKWAWSAFQSSPDPKTLPLPPFAVVGGGGVGGSPLSMGSMLPPPMDPPQIEERLDPPFRCDRPPSVPPDMVAVAPPAPSTIEHSMTQDLRRMLNIGGS